MGMSVVYNGGAVKLFLRSNGETKQVDKASDVFNTLVNKHKDGTMQYNEYLNYMYERDTARRRGKVGGRGSKPLLKDDDYAYWTKYADRPYNYRSNNKSKEYEHPKAYLYAKYLMCIYKYRNVVVLTFSSDSQDVLQEIKDTFDVKSRIFGYGKKYRMEVTKKSIVREMLEGFYNHMDSQQKTLTDKHLNSM